MQMTARPHRCIYGCCTNGYRWRRFERRYLKRANKNAWRKEEW